MAAVASSDIAIADRASPIPESRVFRLPVFRGLGPVELAQSVETASEAGFNGILVPLTVGGLPIFPSPAPRRFGLKVCIPEFRRRDVLGEVCDAARKAGVRLYASVQPWRPGSEVPGATILRWFCRRLDWFAQGLQALRRRRPRIKAKDLSFCPSNPMRRRYVGDLLSEAVEGYPVAGLSFETASLPHSLEPGRERCFCSYCREEAREKAGLDLADLTQKPPPQEALEAWEALQIESIHSAIGYYSQRGHKSRAGLVLHCRTMATKERGEEEPPGPDGQARLAMRLWREGLQMGAIDGLAVEGFPQEAEALAGVLERNLASWPDDALLYPVLTVSEANELPAQLEAVRRYPLTGLVVEWSGALTALAAKQLATTCFSPPAVVAEDDPLRSVGQLFAEVAQAAPPDSGVAEFLTDLLGFAREPKGATESEALDAVVENVRGLEARLLSGQISFGPQERLALCRLSQAKRLARLASHYVSI